MNITRLLYKSELGLANYKNISEIPNDFLQQQGRKVTKIYVLLQSLHSLIQGGEYLNLSQIKDTLEEISFNLNYNDKFKDVFLALRGQYLIRTLLIKNVESRDIRVLLLKIIKLMSPVQEFTSWVMDTSDVVSLIFRLLLNKSLVEEVLKTLNCLFLESSKPFDLTKIHDFYNIASKITNNNKLYLFIRVLFTSCTDFNYHTIEEEEVEDSSLEKIIQQKIDNLRSIYSINQSIVLGIPNILSKLSILLKNSTNSNWISPLIREDIVYYNTFSNHNNNHGNDDLEFDSPTSYRMINVDNISDVLYSLNIETETETSSTAELVKLLKEYTCAEVQTEFLFLIYILLSGPRKSQTIAQLNQLNFIDILIDLFNSIDWKKKEYKEESSPFFAKKMYIIDLLLVWSEVDVVSSIGNCIESKYRMALKEERERVDGQCVNGVGNSRNIINIIFQAYKDCIDFEKEHLSLSFCIESILRTWPDQSLQNFFIENQLLDSLFNEILSNDVRFMENAFDLFGELIKNNRDSFMLVNRLLESKFGGNQVEESTFFNIFLNNLNYSNVCLRYISISLYKFKSDNQRNSNNPKYSPYPLMDCKFYKFFDSHKIIIFKKLLESLTPNDGLNLFVENICCLNTALTFLLLSKKDNQSHQFFNTLREYSSCGRLNRIKLLFKSGGWRDFYTSCPDDRLKLEFSSTFQFKEFNVLVNEILNL